MILKHIRIILVGALAVAGLSSCSQYKSVSSDKAQAVNPNLPYVQPSAEPGLVAPPAGSGMKLDKDAQQAVYNDPVLPYMY